MRRTITPEIGDQIKVAHAAGIGLREFARNANIPEGTVLSFAKRNGLTQAIQAAKGEARLSVQSNAITPMQSVATTMQQRAERHVERIAGVTESVCPISNQCSPARFWRVFTTSRSMIGWRDGISVSVMALAAAAHYLCVF